MTPLDRMSAPQAVLRDLSDSRVLALQSYLRVQPGIGLLSEKTRLLIFFNGEILISWERLVTIIASVFLTV